MALDVPERRIVALRSLPIEGKLSAEASAQLLEAGRWVKGLDDPAVMTPVDIGSQEGLLHAAFLYRLAEPLRGVFRLASFKGSPIPVGVALRIAYDIVLGARAVEACGASPSLGESLCGGLIPDSVLVGQDGRSRLCDAGIGAILRRTQEYGHHSDLLSYAAPEQLVSGGSVDGRSDIFTIGIFLWEMLANRRLFSANQAEAVMEKVRNLEIPALDTLPRGSAEPIPILVANIVKRALERAPSDRYAGTTALLQALETQTGKLMATPETVQSFIAALVGNVFDSRLRSMERAVGTAEPIAGSSPVSAPMPRSGRPSQGRDLRPSAAATKKDPAPILPPSPAPATSVASDTAADLDAYEMLGPESLAPAPDTIREPTEDVEKPVEPPRFPAVPLPPARTSRPAPAAVAASPKLAAMPTLPSRFDLPGAELFATPGLPAVKPAPSTDGPNQSAAPAPSAKPASKASDSPSNIDPVGPTIAVPAESSTPQAEAVNRTESTRPKARPRRARIAWVAIFSVLGFAFVGGLAIRRCMSVANQGTKTIPTEVALSAPSLDASVSATAENTNGAAPPIASDLDAATVLPDAATTALALDAGAPAASAAVTRSAAPPHAHARRTVPRSSGKVAKSRGKTTRTK
jgi:serine/threonine-protein kinase